ncbi:transglycosylase domain-containing protein [Salimicrobium halophilum]|uniref:Membrane carboxypeptidase (Penicillin-binding protein) n=1 Tax=Salimicrobium halophilum TaxID=86666 RepID=A0A1G8W9T7_9BACI|nr:transglycosylase domain-containing protein [Salimicrobium halophilum]SDJ75042.1 Membrane carboxypeptidase (penicillin-binding protein) [Salimicrobium halophilum]
MMKWWKRIFRLMVLLLLAGAGAFVYLLSLGPPSLETEQTTVYYDSSDEQIGEDHGTEERYWIPLKEMPESMISATIAIEDRNFYDHFGFDFKRMAAAMWKNISSFRLEEGASTLTQQYARNLFLTHEKTWTRKMKEAVYAARLELFYSKDELLEGYLNTVYYGHGVYGVEAASRYFFDKPAKELSTAESSMLAGIPKGPTYYSPLNDRKRAKDRQELVLKAMKRNGWDGDVEKTVLESLAYREEEDTSEEIASYFQDEVVKEAARVLELTPDEVETSGLHIYTTLNRNHQQALEKSVQETIPSHSGVQTAGMIVDHGTGAITAILGGKDYETSPFNRATQAKRMIGSVMKPFLYYTALDRGYTPLTMLESKPTTFTLADGKVYEPSNFQGYYADRPVTMAQALAVSDNIYAVKTNMDIGPEALVQTLHSFGMDGDIPAVPSLALGSASIPLKEVSEGFAKLASGSGDNYVHTISRITDRKGNVLYEYAPTFEKTNVDPIRSFMVTHMMTGMFDTNLSSYMSVTGSGIKDELTHSYSGKSGTTESDSWMAGSSTDVTTVIWNGYDDARNLEMHEHFAKDIWAKAMEDIHSNLENEGFRPPPTLRGVYIDPESGKRSAPGCGAERLVYMRPQNVPTATCKNEIIDEDTAREDPWLHNIADWVF